MYRVNSVWSFTEGAGSGTSDHSGVSLRTGVTEITGVSKARIRGVSGYLNYFIGLSWDKITSSLAHGMSYAQHVMRKSLQIITIPTLMEN